ncbi:TPA: protein YchT [Escherichia coli]|nr:protein YchT [Escherichia coli]
MLSKGVLSARLFNHIYG